mmetsp:Transcript_46504/g.108093  ORF Transcript_46504/g.108093 Transcript_46504/m.108093 type:complete len:205 (-) Transcript_46504:327-941(-)
MLLWRSYQFAVRQTRVAGTLRRHRLVCGSAAAGLRYVPCHAALVKRLARSADHLIHQGAVHQRCRGAVQPSRRQGALKVGGRADIAQTDNGGPADVHGRNARRATAPGLRLARGLGRERAAGRHLTASSRCERGGQFDCRRGALDARRLQRCDGQGRFVPQFPRARYRLMSLRKAAAQPLGIQPCRYVRPLWFRAWPLLHAVCR